MKYLILGAGPAGLTAANRILEKSTDDFLVIEKESTAGGLCRSLEVDGAPLDIGGGHFLDTRNRAVDEYLFRFMPENEWNTFERISKIDIRGNIIDHPIESNIWQMPKEDQVEYLKSIAIAGCNLGTEMPDKFVDWIYWKLGCRIAEDYMIPYNRKMYGDELNQLGTYWLEKLPNVSFDETLLSCLERRAYGREPGHARFYYPKNYGYGELWLRMAETISGHIEYNRTVKGIDFCTGTVWTKEGKTYQADNIITTIPWRSYQEIGGAPQEFTHWVSGLKHSSVQIEYFPDKLETQAQWIYYPDPELSYHRVLVRHNFINAKGYWTETNADRVENKNRRQASPYKNMNEYAYPLNTIDKPDIMNRLLKWCDGHHVYGLGRWGEHQHYNSDVTVERAISLVDDLFGF